MAARLINEFHMYPREMVANDFSVSTATLGNIGEMRALKRLLLKSGQFPIWTIDTVKSNSYPEFMARNVMPTNLLNDQNF